MRLISLTANKESFHAVHFREAGPSLIVASQKDPTATNVDRTYNGVGKSLLLALIHFCLGSSKKDEFQKKLPGWRFVLEFEHGGDNYRVSRSTDKQGVVNFNGVETKLKEYCAKLERRVFSLLTPVQYMSFRSLLPAFARPRRESYVEFDQTKSGEKPYQRLLRTAFLLGLDIELVQKKHKYREEGEKVRKQRESLKKDSIFVEFFTGNKNAEIELRDLEGKIQRLRENLQGFQIAEDYHDRQREADAAARRVQSIRNEQVVVRNAIANINTSLQVTPDVKPEMLFRAYEEARLALPERVTHTVEEVAAFHEKLLSNRIRRLTSERNRLEDELESLERQVGTANRQVDALRRFLGTHGALDEFLAMSESLNELEAKAQKLRDYRELLETYSTKAQDLKAKLSNETIRASAYLKDARPLLNSNIERFREFSGRFYGERPGGLTVANNEGDNQIRFNIDVHIEDDAADGINEVKIFCFDMTLLTQRHNHHVDFLVHDSRLFGDIDPRQRATIFKLAQEVTTERNLQYIATVNQDQIDAMRTQFTNDEFERCIENAEVLRLTDDSAEAKLLGIQVDMQY